jgi:hypothetical protein
MEHTNDSHELLRALIDKQKTLIDIQCTRIEGYIAIIDYISALARSKNVQIPLASIISLMEAKTTEKRNDLLFSLKQQILFGMSDYNEQTTWNVEPDSWNSPEWDDGAYFPNDSCDEFTETSLDIDRWPTFERKWRLFGNGN